ncbi:MAG: EutN/CcmL family microcompartment protein [Planctomycetota bacterium]|nr:EutN/CcmL family microcompartment protein [Planctomycetota bacterium]
MFLADVVGTVVSPVQIPILDGEKLLLLRPLTPDGRPASKTRIAIDRAQAGEGDRVICIDEGNSARQILGDPKGPVKTVIVGVVDYVEHEGRVAYDARTRAPIERLGQSLDGRLGAR